MKLAVFSAVVMATIGLSACATSSLAGMGSEIQASAGEYGDYSKQWEKASREERKGIELIESGEKRVAKAEKKIRDARKDIRNAEEAIARGEGEVRRGERQAAAGKADRAAVEAKYKIAARVVDERAVEVNAP